ncbi:redoxin domain-containing protein [Kineococcus gynurae]|uniref:Redoxin domain-containing protein n=1 Tax=Kineococcus gynurae TaxID=452979 RepID=A0ABV5LQE9_9ACTN
MVDQFGGDLDLAELWAEGPALLVLLPAAFSPHCTSEVGALVAAEDRLRTLGVQPAVVSCDPVPALRAWGEALGVAFPLLSDFWPHGAVARALDAFDAHRGVATRRSLLVVDGSPRWSACGGPDDVRDLGAHLDEIERVLRDPVVGR